MRIVAGRFGGRRLHVPAGRDTRPTGERVREALFSILGDAVAGARVADLYAGTGALGLEALSRGAAQVDLYESGRPALAVIARNVGELGCDGEVAVVRVPLPRGLGAGPAYGVVLCDPPWGKQLGEAAIDRLLAVGRLAPGGLVVLEEAQGKLPAAAWWEARGLLVDDERRYGDTAIAIARRP
ncbi:MAG: 16S rRNA (guanine(966)-N(2))-methyltransferase RsmD [Myxococcales bacterium]|nr:16S rRNA (guanine(966)-N(2))-methyltransferase RsmD [Myxococcales bacterium]MCB9735705.1 16S rRNA (guanine(966)-N(2))-methyltransferase RsmD [Deltaproteobacteria bacterium]